MNTTQQIETRRDIAMQMAVERADRDQAGWSEKALDAVRLFVAKHRGEQFLAEAIREWCEQAQVVKAPSNERAWGAVMRRAAKEGCVRKVGYAPSHSSNLSPKTLWQAV